MNDGAGDLNNLLELRQPSEAQDAGELCLNSN